MNLARIAARVAAAPSPYQGAGGGGGTMQEPDWGAVENTLVNALANLDLAAVEKEGSILLEGYEPWDTLWKDHGIGVNVTVSQGEVGVSVQGEGDTDLIGSWPMAEFNEEAQAEAANLALAAMAGFFHAE